MAVLHLSHLSRAHHPALAGRKNPFGWTIHNQDDALHAGFGVFVLEYVNAKNLPAITSLLWGAANIQKLSFFSDTAYTASYFTNILDAAVRKCTCGDCRSWWPDMTDSDIVLQFGENIVEIEDITPQKLHVWAHLLHQISSGFAENMKNKCWESDYTEDDWAMLSINYLIVLWIGFSEPT